MAGLGLTVGHLALAGWLAGLAYGGHRHNRINGGQRWPGNSGPMGPAAAAKVGGQGGGGLSGGYRAKAGGGGTNKGKSKHG